jgi:hypothetical protein
LRSRSLARAVRALSASTKPPTDRPAADTPL